MSGHVNMKLILTDIGSLSQGFTRGTKPWFQRSQVTVVRHAMDWLNILPTVEPGIGLPTFPGCPQFQGWSWTSQCHNPFIIRYTNYSSSHGIAPSLNHHFWVYSQLSTIIECDGTFFSWIIWTSKITVHAPSRALGSMLSSNWQFHPKIISNWASSISLKRILFKLDLIVKE